MLPGFDPLTPAMMNVFNSTMYDKEDKDDQVLADLGVLLQ